MNKLNDFLVMGLKHLVTDYQSHRVSRPGVGWVKDGVVDRRFTFSLPEPDRLKIRLLDNSVTVDTEQPLPQPIQDAMKGIE